MDHRTQSLKFLKSSGLIPVQVPEGQKAPFPDWEPRAAEKQDQSGVLAHLEHKKHLNLGALFHGRWVDVDIDTNDPYLNAALDHFLPYTPYVWGRRSKPRSHRAYLLFDEFDRERWGGILRYIKMLSEGKLSEASLSVEVRGGKPENGLFTILPGSYRADVGEHVEWTSAFDPSVSGSAVDISRLIKSVRMAIAAALIAPYWVEGTRNDTSMALGGLLHRIRAFSLAAYGVEGPEDITDPTIMLLEKRDAEHLLRGIMTVAGDSKDDIHSRILSLNNTWQKLDKDSGGKVTGGKVLAGMLGEPYGPKVVKALYRLLSDNDGAEDLEAMAEQFVIWYGRGLLIDLEMVSAGENRPWMNKNEAEVSLGGRKLTVADKKIPLVNLLFGTQLIQRVRGMTFDPSTQELLVQTPEGLKVNQFKGWGMEPSSQRVLDEQVQEFLDYIKIVVCSGDEEAYSWVLDWLADVLQYPHLKPGTALVLVGPQGAGKTFLGEGIMGPIIGDTHSVQVNSIEAVTSKFNAISSNRIFIQCNESTHSYQREAAAKLKAAITDDKITIEPKGIDSYQAPNHGHYLFTSNDEAAAVFIDPSPFERRYTVLRVSEKYANDVEYWTKFRAWVKLNLPKIMRFLLDRSYNRETVRRPLQTEAKRMIQRVNVDSECAWIIARLASGFLLHPTTHVNWYDAFNQASISADERRNNVLRRDVWPDVVSTIALEEDYKLFVRNMGRPIYSGSVLTTIRRVFPHDALSQDYRVRVAIKDPRSGQLIHDRKRLTNMSKPEEIMEHLRKKYGAVIDQLTAQAHNEMKDLFTEDKPRNQVTDGDAY